MTEFEYRLYYTDDGRVKQYSVVKLDGPYIVITREQYAEGRLDAIVKNGKLVYTHKQSHVRRLARSSTGVRTSKYDVNILSNDSDSVYWDIEHNEI